MVLVQHWSFISTLWNESLHTCNRYYTDRRMSFQWKLFTFSRFVNNYLMTYLINIVN